MSGKETKDNKLPTSTSIHAPIDSACTSVEECDSDLDELLDDTLTDFDVYASPKPSASSAAEVDQPKSNVKSEDDFAKEFLKSLGIENGGGDFDRELQMLLQDDPTLKDEFNKLNQAAGAAAASNPGTEKDFAQTLAETINSLSQNTESLQSDMSEEEIMRKFQESLNFGAEGDANPEASFIPMMQNMMSNLLSKDIIYPSLKDLADKYPAWLSVNNGKLPKNEFDQYAKQFDIVTQLCDEYDSEKSTDSQQTKDERFERILDLMTQMQDCGSPPKEIVTELAPGLNFDPDGNPQLPGMDNCSIM